MMSRTWLVLVYQLAQLAQVHVWVRVHVDGGQVRAVPVAPVLPWQVGGVSVVPCQVPPEPTLGQGLHPRQRARPGVGQHGAAAHRQGRAAGTRGAGHGRQVVAGDQGAGAGVVVVGESVLGVLGVSDPAMTLTTCC